MFMQHAKHFHGEVKVEYAHILHLATRRRCKISFEFQSSSPTGKGF